MDLFWILVNEDTPEDGVRVLVTTSQGYVNDATYWKNGELGGILGPVWEISGEFTREIIAWMPWPAPYRPWPNKSF